MPGQIRITFRNFRSLDLSDAQRARPPRRKQNAFGEETILREALRGLAAVSSGRRDRINGLLDMASAPPGSLNLAGAVPGAIIRSPIPDFTATVGFTGSVGAVVAYGGSTGIYFWNKRPGGEVGLYGSLSVGLITNIGASAGDVLTFLFGPAPSVLAGDSITVSVDVGVDVLTFSGLLILNAPPVSAGWPPTITGPWRPEIIGVGFAITAGFSALPVDISVMPGRTWTRPIT